MKPFSTHWKSSKKPRKQRKYQANAPLHTRRRFLSVNISTDLRKKYTTRNIPVHTGDRVKVLRGHFKKKSGKVSSVDLIKTRVFIEGIEKSKRDGSKRFVPFHPSNLQLVELNLDDKERKKTLRIFEVKK